MIRPYNRQTLSAFEQFAHECHVNARINRITISADHIMDMWRHLPEHEERSPQGNPSVNQDNITHSWSGRGL